MLKKVFSTPEHLRFENTVPEKLRNVTSLPTIIYILCKIGFMVYCLLKNASPSDTITSIIDWLYVFSD